MVNYIFGCTLGVGIWVMVGEWLGPPQLGSMQGLLKMANKAEGGVAGGLFQEHIIRSAETS